MTDGQWGMKSLWARWSSLCSLTPQWWWLYIHYGHPDTNRSPGWSGNDNPSRSQPHPISDWRRSYHLSRRVEELVIFSSRLSLHMHWCLRALSDSSKSCCTWSYLRLVYPNRIAYTATILHSNSDVQVSDKGKSTPPLRTVFSSDSWLALYSDFILPAGRYDGLTQCVSEWPWCENEIIILRSHRH